VGSKLSFWLMVIVAAILGIYAFKLIAARSNMPGLQAFAEGV
jgi:hypothetical protein